MLFNSITGVLTEKKLDSICVTSGGLEWLLSVCPRSIDGFGLVGEKTRVFTWLQHWDEGMKLFGFPDDIEREAFLELLRVEGVGPKQGMKILSGIRPLELKEAVESDNLAKLQKIPGVGPKLAQKIVLALKGRYAHLMPISDGQSAGEAWPDIIKALVEMGYDRRSAQDAVLKAALAVTTQGAERERDIFKKAILELSTSSL